LRLGCITDASEAPIITGHSKITCRLLEKLLVRHPPESFAQIFDINWADGGKALHGHPDESLPRNEFRAGG